MKETRLIMGMPIEIEIVGENAEEALEAAFAYLTAVDERFSTYKEDSEISRINRGELALATGWRNGSARGGRSASATLSTSQRRNCATLSHATP